MNFAERMLQRVASAGSTGVVAVTPDGTLSFVNVGLAKMLGRNPEDMIGRSLFDFVEDEAQEALARQKLGRRREGLEDCYELRLEHVDGSTVWTLVDAGPLANEAGGSFGSLAILTNISAQRRIEQALRNTQERLAVLATERATMFHELYSAAPDAIVVSDEGGAIMLANPEAERLLRAGPGALVGISIDTLLPAARRGSHAERRREFFHEKHPRPMGLGLDLVARRLDGVEVPVDISLSTFQYDGQRAALTIMRDVTQRKKLEQQLARVEGQLRDSQKLQALGQLAGGVAHDFNNLLTVISCYAQLALGRLPPADPLFADLTEVHRAARRAEDLTRSLLAFGRQQVLRPRVVDLDQVVRGLERMLQRLLGEANELAVVSRDRTWKVFADPGQLEQVLVNLVVNARDAMPTGGRVTIELADVTLGPEVVAEHADVMPGPHVLLTVTDTGVGMDAATRARIFDPFFTTKGPGKGTGLGLSIVFGIVNQSGGHVWVTSEPGQGTSFKLAFPRATGEAEPPVAEPVAPRTLVGTETVLVVEDDDAVRAVTRTTLERAGYTVLEAQNGGEAFLACEGSLEPIHLLLTDVVMPRMSGPELAERLTKMRPTMRVLYVSGYTETTVVRHGVVSPGVAFLQKPVSTEGLLRKVREVLDTPG